MDSKILNSVRSAYGWVVTGTVVRHGLNLILTMVLARMLAPTDYGLVGITGVFISIINTIQVLGMASAVAYFNDDDSKLPTYYTTTAVMGILLTIFTWTCAPLVARWYENDQIIPILRALSFMILLGGFKAISEARLGRALQFKTLVFVENTVGIMCGLAAVAMAANGFGAWSLVANWVMIVALQTGTVLYMVPPKFALKLDAAVLKKALRYGLPQTGSLLLWKMSDNSDYLVIGKLLGSGPLGIYTVAFRMATLVNEKVSAIVSRVSFNAFAALKDAPDRGAAHWLSLTDKIATVNFALLAYLAVLGEDIVLVMLGTKWQAAILPMRILCIVGALKTLSSITSSILTANGRTVLVFTVTVVNVIVLPVAFAAACLIGGVIGVAIAWAVVMPFSLFYLVHRATRVVAISPLKYLQTLKGPLTMAAMCALCPLPVVLALQPGLPRLLLGGSLGGICGAFLLIRHPFVRRLYADWSNREAKPVSVFRI